MISSISSFQITNADTPDPKFFFSIAVYVADAAVVNPNDTKTLLPNGVSTPFICGKPAVINGLTKREILLFLLLLLVVSFNKFLYF